ncbi:TonB-dependent receptor domain-containing protein [Arcicella lustrica]|uniref:TonB-dependent receptor n=1 Tax=Arcicella lustrica TaxID=2984196 RepID=A0ABU5SKS4_9BACT|nr:TonB-dependent receptor [Arcicella sp. DC25W]MEA5427860.1 TonB-dependent receptor [Arcicella sp. DC25W]
MKKLFLFLLITNYAFGQISGKVQNIKNEPIAFANVILYSAKDSSIVAGTTTNELGVFALNFTQTGDFFTKTSFIGYENYVSKVFNISNISKIIELETIYLKDENNTLEEVTISAKRELIQTTPIGKIINIQSSLLTKGSNALQVFERLPGVITDRRNNQFSLNGQNGVTVLFNGRKVQMPIEEIMALLENTVADNIEKIELITSPTAQYDADGGAGIINIIFKSNETLGTKINFSATAGYGFREKAVTTIGVAKGYKKLNLNTSYSFNHDVRKSGYEGDGTAGISFMLGETFNTFYGITRRYQNTHNLNFAAQYQPNPKTTLGVDFVGAFDKSQNLVNNGGTYQPKNGEYFEIMMLSDGLTTKQNNISSAYLKQNFSPKTQFNVDLTYINYTNNSPATITSEYFDKQKQPIKPQFSIFTFGNRGESVSKIHVGVFKTDLSTQFSEKINADFGIKMSYAKNENDSKVERKVNDSWEIDPRSQSQLKSQEQIAAAYSQVKLLLNAKTNLLLGLRYEYWKRNFSNQEDPFEISKFFPSILYTYAINQNTSINFNYSRRISRPAYTDLISNLFYTDPTFVFSGNPLLKPTLSDMLKVEYSRNGLSVGISAQYDLNPILRYQITSNATEDMGISSPQNLDYMKSLNLFITYPLQITKWWKFTLNSLTSLRDYKVSYSQFPTEKRYLFQNLNISQQINLPKNFEIELSGWYNFPYFEGPNKIKAFGVANVGIGKKLKNDNGTFLLTLPDVFRSFSVYSHNGGMTPIAFDINTISNWRDETVFYRVIKLTYSRSFGGNIKRTTNSFGDEEKSRVGN